MADPVRAIRRCGSDSGLQPRSGRIMSRKFGRPARGGTAGSRTRAPAGKMPALPGSILQVTFAAPSPRADTIGGVRDRGGHRAWPDTYSRSTRGRRSTRALLFDEAARVAAVAQEPFAQHFPRPGEVEHDAEDLWTTTVATVRTVLEKAGCGAGAIAAVGIANQRETAIVWERSTGRPIHRAIVWQDRRTAGECDALRAGGHEALVSERTGLILDPYFSATKIAWILDHVEGARGAGGGRRARLRHGGTPSSCGG